MIYFKKLGLFLCFLPFFACKKSEIVNADVKVASVMNVDSSKYTDSIQKINLDKRISGPSAGNFSSSQNYNLNIIYFVPIDLNPATGFQQRLSKLLLWTQDWFKQQMSANGYPNTTFGLYTNAAKDNVRLIIIFGKKDKTQYDYNNGAGNVLSEMNEYFAANPLMKKGDHNLIILPSFFMQADGTPGGGNIGPPFYGLGKNCFALDYEGLDIQYKGINNTPLGRAFITWFGGMVHELGHGVNLPHNRQKVSENSDPNKGMALMWAGNSTLGLSPTFLTAADAAVLNVNQVFSKTAGIFYGSTTASLKRVYSSYDNVKKTIIVKGSYTSNVPVKSILCFNDPNVNNEGTGANRDYNAIAWETKPIGLDSFYLEMPIDELVEKSDGMNYEARIKLVHENGNVTTTAYNYYFSGGIPIVSFGTKTEINKTNWQVISFSSQEISTSYPGYATRLIDGNINTYWHSNWSQQPASSHPHYITIDTKLIQPSNGIILIQRQDSGAGRCKDIEVWSSTDNVNWTKLFSRTLPNSSGQQNIDFTSGTTLRYFKIVVNSSYTSSAETNCSLAEAGLY